MGKLIKGPFQIQWGSNPILEVSEVTFNYDVATNDYDTVQGTHYSTEGAITASVAITLLASDIASLAVVLPQYYVAQGGTLSTGETVTAEEGAIDIVAAQCDTTNTAYPLDVTSCNGETVRLVNARTRLSNVSLDNNAVRTVEITFLGEAPSGQAAIQFLAEDTES